MGSSFFGESSMGSGRSPSSRKGKKTSSDKPKQPQRGLGVAQLEKIRLQNQMGGYLPSPQSPFHSNLNMDDMGVQMALPSSPSSSFNIASTSALFAPHPSVMMEYGNTERRHIGYGEFINSNPTARSLMNHSSNFLPHQYAPPTITLPLLEQSTENSAQKKRPHDRSYSTGSISQNSDSGDAQEIDLDLKLSL